ncbi:SGNH/GDSL hydrolase family protein [Kitasatospora sp. NPDC002227]|uniref:SGNH/GDSL hydrolase family protein n=1 Tax=Kitasatospora sp. NPDC002227 TaxID=3154773 RepID=UPI00331E0B73
MRAALLRPALAVAAIAAVLGTAAPASAAAPERAAKDTPRYYLALGDSLAAGYQSLPGGGHEVGHGYAQDLAATLGQRAKAAHHSFSFTDLGCPGETTASMMNGGCPYPHPYQDSQLTAAIAFLRAHHGDRTLVTVDIGANDVDGCLSSGKVDLPCALNGVTTVGKNLDTILGKLRAAAGPHTRIVGMNLYDPFLAVWLTGPQGQAQATLSVPLADVLNTTIGLADAAHGVPTADVAGAFSTDAFSPTVPFNGRQIPLNVARVMQWTNMSRGDIHANDAGYQVIADAFLAKI